MDAKLLDDPYNSVLTEQEVEYYKYLISNLTILQNGEIIEITFKKNREGKIIAKGIISVNNETIPFSTEIEVIDEINIEMYTILFGGFKKEIFAIDKYIINGENITNICKMANQPIAIKSIALFNTEKVSR